MNHRQVLAYLGQRGNHHITDERVLQSITQAENELTKACGKPKSAAGIWKCRVESTTVSFGGIEIKSVTFAKHMKNAKHIGIFAATLGAQADMLINRYSVSDMSQSVIVDAVASVLVNDYCNEICKELASHPEVAGFDQTKRYSPGYGDFDLRHQQELLNILNADKRIGLTLTSGNMLVPTKSVTAAVGFV